MLAPLNELDSFQHIGIDTLQSKSLNSIKEDTANALFEFLSKKNIWSRFSSFLLTCHDLHPHIGKLLNKINRYGKKTDDINSLNKTIGEIDSLFSNQDFIARLSLYFDKIKTKNMLSADLFSDGTFSGLKDLLIAKIRRNRLTHTAINQLKKKEILDILQVNNKFKNKDGESYRVLDVSGRGVNRIYTLSNSKKAKIVNNQLELISDSPDSVSLSSSVANQVDNQVESGSVGHQEKLTKINFGSISGTNYQLISNAKGHDYTRFPVVNVNVDGQSSFLIKLENGILFDLCIGADGKQYKIIDYVSATENTGYTMNLVKVQDGKQTKVFRLVGEPGSKDCYLETEILVKREVISFKRKLLLFLQQKRDPVQTESIVNISRNPGKHVFEYTTVTGKVIPQNQNLALSQIFPFLD